MKKIYYAPVLLSLCISQAWADTPIQLQHASTASAHVHISNVAGSVTVTAWDRDEVQVQGQLGDGSKPLAITGSDDDLTIKVEPQGGSGWFNWGGNNRMGSSTLELHVPRHASLDIGVVSAPLVIVGTDGGAITVNTVSGKVSVEARTPSLTVESVSGNIEQAGNASEANLQTVSGDILAPAVSGKVKLQTISGHIQATGSSWQKLTLSTVSGDAQINGGLAPSGEINIDSMSGNVQLRLPENTNASVHASSFSGVLRSDFGTPQKTQNDPGSSLDAQLGNRNGTIRVETFSGDLHIRKED